MSNSKKGAKVLSAALATTMLFTSVILFSGCSQKKTDLRACNVEIQKEDQWYSGKVINLNESIDKKNYDGYMFEDPVLVGDYIIDVFTGYASMQYDENNICIFDMEGNLKSQQVMEVPEGTERSILGYVQQGDKVAIYCRDSSYGGGRTGTFKIMCDPSTGELGTEEELDIDFGASGYASNTQSLKDYLIVQYNSYTGEGSTLWVLKDDQVFTTVDLVKELGESWAYVSDARMDGDNIVLELHTETQQYKFTIDPSGNHTSEKSTSIMQHSCLIGEDGKTYQMSFDGIYVDEEPYFEFSNCDVGFETMSYANLMSVTDGRIIMNKMAYDSIEDTSVVKVIILDKQDENPNAGKTVITAASPFWGVDAISSEGIVKFNKESKDYFIKCICKEYPTDEAEQEKYVSNFCFDLLADDGPDIIFKSEYLGDINYSEYFLDLNDDIKLNEKDYYMNVFNGCKQDGKLYFVPLSFGTEGILTDKSNVKEGAKGFTFDEYKDFVSTTCNGTDPTAEFMSKDEYFMTCFRSMNDLWFKDGKIDLDQDAFVELANFVKDNVPEKATVEENGVYFISADDSEPARYTFVQDISDYLWQTNNMENPVLLGVPSVDGRGAGCQIYESVSVNANTKVKDGCVDFINILLSSEIQESGTSIPLNKTVCEAKADKAIKAANDKFNKNLESMGVTEQQLLEWGYTKPSENAKENFLAIPEGLSYVNMYYEDALSNVILEEAEAYFSGQKDSSELISNLENRIQTYLDENKE